MCEYSNTRAQSCLKISVVILLIAGGFIPFISINVVPEWELKFVNEDGVSVPLVKFDQIWKNYSLELWSLGENSERNLQSDPDGYIKLPARQIRVSIFQILISYVRDAIMKINPHASFGPESYIVCRGKHNCLASYKKDESLQLIVVR